MSSEEIVLAKCPYCLAEIPAEAKKCRHCGEWIENNSKWNNSFCFWYSKVIAIINIIAIIYIIIEWTQAESNGNGYVIGKLICIAMSMIVAVGFWRYEHTKSRWPFIITAISSTALSILLIYLLIAGTTGQIFMRE